MNESNRRPSLFLLSSLAIGGSERKIVRITNELHRRGIEVHLGYLNGPDTLLSELEAGVPRICLERKGKFSPRAATRLMRYVHRYDIARIVCVNLYPLLYAIPAALVGWRRRLSCVVLVNTTDLHSRKEGYQMLLYAPLLRRVSRIVFGSGFQMEQWRREYRLPEKKCSYIYNGVNEIYYSPTSLRVTRREIRASLGLSDNDFIVGTVGQLRPEKQQRDLVEAVSALRAKGKYVKALIAGAGEEKVKLEKLIHERGLEDEAFLLGEVKDPRPVLAAMDVFALTSASETFSNAALEAMSMGIPVVLSDIGGAREMVQDDVNGYLYPKGDVDALAGVLGALMGDAMTVARLGQEARTQLIERFSFSKMVNQYEALLSMA